MLIITKDDIIKYHEYMYPQFILREIDKDIFKMHIKNITNDDLFVFIEYENFKIDKLELKKFKIFLRHLKLKRFNENY